MAPLFSQLRNRASRLTRSHFVRNVATVGGGIAISQIITLSLSPFITRLYGPEAFGAAAALAAIVSIITPIATLGYGNAIVMPDSEKEAGAVVRLSILFGLIMVPFSLGLVQMGKPWLVKWTGLEHHPWVLYLIPLSLLVTAFLSVADQAAIRQGLYKSKAQAYVGSTFLTNIGKVANGFLAPSGLMLILITQAGSILNVLIQLLIVPRQGVLQLRNWFGFSGVLDAACAQRDFALYRMPQSILYSATFALPTLLLASLFGSGIAGQYTLAATALAAPVLLLGQAIGEVFYPKITRAIAEKSPAAYSLLFKATMGLALIAVIPAGVIMLWGDRIFPIVFGADWRKAGEYAQWMSLTMAVTLASRACVSAMPALRLQRFLLGREIVSIVLRTGALYLGFSWFQSDVAAVALFSISGFLVTVWLVYVTHRRLLRETNEWLASERQREA